MIRVLIAGPVLILVALTFDSSVLFVPGIGLAILGVVMPSWIWLAARGVRVSRELHQDRVLEDQPVEATIEVRRGLLGLPGGEVLDEFAGGALSVSGRHPAMGSRHRSTVRVVARFPRRGRRAFDPPTVALRDPLGLFRAVCPGSGTPRELLVLPRTETLRWINRADGERLELASGARSTEPLAATEVDGLRPYHDGTPASRIHWAALAHGGELLERHLRADADSGPLVVLDARCQGPVELLDAAVRAAASLVLELARRSGCELLLPGERRPIQIGADLGAWPAAHARLALIEGGAGAQPPGLDLRPRASLYYVAARRPEQLRAAVRRESRSGFVLVLPAELADGLRYAPIFDVAGCRAFAVGARQRMASWERAA